MKILFTVFGIVLGFMLLYSIFALVLAFPVMWLWNWLMPVIFGLPTISATQAFGLQILTLILFGSVKASGGGKSNA